MLVLPLQDNGLSNSKYTKKLIINFGDCNAITKNCGQIPQKLLLKYNNKHLLLQACGSQINQKITL
jgi:hypothetical protein